MNSARGFTLIEILIAISIITIITGATIPSFNNYIRNQNVKQAQEQVVDELRTIQNKALNGEMSDTLVEFPVGSGNYTEVLYWGLRFIANSNQITRFVTADNTSCNPTGSESSVDRANIRLYGGTKFNSASSPCVYFSFKNGNASGATTLRFGPEDLQIGQVSCLSVFINEAGLITKGGAYAACN